MRLISFESLHPDAGPVLDAFLKDSFSPRAHEYPLSHGKPEYSYCNFAVFL